MGTVQYVETVGDTAEEAWRAAFEIGCKMLGTVAHLTLMSASMPSVDEFGNPTPWRACYKVEPSDERALRTPEPEPWA